ncbi:undecaprenyl-diphosphatase [Kineosphaera limosa]|uniref:Phosphatidic acid phosphatase type 2/haloperoxidase domain-containing protein n=1 Tax=Kineosphaera limosa NBRC 100340 TaxID=1184609 RepID=K6WBS1_9MICO|nr:phosphatase PAP2 family protein [Kineosphaera limosa]NYE01528.1 undecaprenyl-diphosphatase [Kineosphaera limosa]GAB96685.1 hypothetical protein KILIM_045_00160 [Kineosphaera limosa NBRC 100340]
MPEARAALPRIGRGLLAAVVTCVPVAVLAGLVQAGFSPLHRLDEAAIVAATDHTRSAPALRAALLAWQEVFLPWHVYLAAAPVAVWTWRRGLRARTLWGVATALVGWNMGLNVKLLVQRARPVVEDAIEHAPGYSFPSGHVFNVTMASATVIVMAWPLLRRHRAVARTVVATAAVVTVVTMLDRVFLGVHYPSDTVVGVLLGLALTYSSWTGFSHGRPPRDLDLPERPARAAQHSAPATSPGRAAGGSA